MVLIPGGEFVMGDDHGEDDEKPAHRVRISPFYMDICEVTQESFQAMMGRNPSKSVGPDQAGGARELARRRPVLQHAVDPGGLQAVLRPEDACSAISRPTATGCRPRPNGNTPAARAPPRAGRSATTRASWASYAWFKDNSAKARRTR